MKTIAVIRKPLVGTVAKNVLMHGCGGLNIDVTRVGAGEDRTSGGLSGSQPSLYEDGFHQDRRERPTGGRWPSNLILSTTAAEVLDEQTGELGNNHRESKANGSTSIWGSGSSPPVDSISDIGGASRFFKNIKEDLVSYLRDLITPPEGVVKVVPLDMVEPSGTDSSVHGFIVLGTPTPEQCEEMLRICKPGAHVLLIAPEEQPTGHTGMCRMEDTGFEVRDTILLLLEAGGFWYIPKPSRTEREAGCHNLSKKQQDESRKDGNPGGDNPRNRGLKPRGNSHPTVKPFAIMQALMEGQEGPVVDPFMGSGSTGIAALHTGQHFIGIEREEEYLNISDTRIRHWADSQWRGRMTEVVSDLEAAPEPEPDVMDLGSLFGLGGSE